MAIHQGEVVDSDRDLGTIAERIEAKYADGITLIRKVEISE